MILVFLPILQIHSFLLLFFAFLVSVTVIDILITIMSIPRADLVDAVKWAGVCDHDVPAVCLISFPTFVLLAYRYSKYRTYT
jgi:hypothetical protein